MRRHSAPERVQRGAMGWKGAEQNMPLTVGGSCFEKITAGGSAGRVWKT